MNSASSSPDGHRIVTASGDRKVRIWDAASGEVIRVLTGHRGWVNNASFSPDGHRIVTASGDRKVRIWDAASGEVIRVLTGHDDWVYSASFSPDGHRIVTASKDRTTRIWDATSGEVIRVLNGHEDAVHRCASRQAPFMCDMQLGGSQLAARKRRTVARLVRGYFRSQYPAAAGNTVVQRVN